MKGPDIVSDVTHIVRIHHNNFCLCINVKSHDKEILDPMDLGKKSHMSRLKLTNIDLSSEKREKDMNTQSNLKK